MNNPSAPLVILLNQTKKPMNSKLELRLEAAKIAAELEGVTLDNFHEAVSRIERYILGGAELPEQDGAMPELMDMLKSAREKMEREFGNTHTAMGVTAQHVADVRAPDSLDLYGIGPCTGIGDTEALKVLQRSKEVLGTRYAPERGPSVF